MGEASVILEDAKKKGVELRLMGALAVRTHCPRFSFVQDGLKRELSDIDFMAYRKQFQKINEFFQEIGYSAPDLALQYIHAGNRLFFYSKTNDIKVDIFLDKLEMCHTIDFRKRLEHDYPTITLADVVLEKLQIVKINEKDLIDTTILLREHNIGEDESETVDSKYISRILANDWGFYYTATVNLKKIKDFAGQCKVMSNEDCRDVVSKIDNLLAIIEKEPKSIGWKVRSKIGTSKKWYNEVEEPPKY